MQRAGGPATSVHEPLAPGFSIGSTVAVSPQQRWLTYNVFEAMVGRTQWLVRIDGPQLGVPRKVELPPQQSFSGLDYAPGEDLVAFGASLSGAPGILYLCQLDEDGACTPQPWSIPIGPGGALNEESASFSPDGSKLAYVADPDGDGTNQLFLTGTSPGDAGEAVQLSAVPAGLGAGGGLFAADGLTVYFLVIPGKLFNGPRQLFAVDLAVDPPGPPVLVSPPIVTKSRQYRFLDDMSSMLVWSGDTDLGDLSWVRLNGTQASAPVPLHNEPGRVRFVPVEWTPDGKRVIYSAENPDEPDEGDLFMVDLSGPEPSPPVHLSAPVAAGGGVSNIIHFGTAADRVFYFANPSAKEGSELWMVNLNPVTPAIKLSAPLPPSSYLPGDLEISSDGARVAYVGPQETEDLYEQFLVELAGPSAPIKLNPQLEAGSHVASGSKFSPDGTRLFFTVEDEADKRRIFQVDVTPSPGTPVQVSDEDHDVDFTMLILPAGAP